MNRQHGTDHALASAAKDYVRAGADQRVWQAVAERMDRVAAVDSVAFRVGHVGRGWRVAARLLMVVAMIARFVRPRSRRGASDEDAATESRV